MRKPSIILAISGALSKPPYAALWKSSVCRIQLVNGFHLGQIWVTKEIFGLSDSGRSNRFSPATTPSTIRIEETAYEP